MVDKNKTWSRWQQLVSPQFGIITLLSTKLKTQTKITLEKMRVGFWWWSRGGVWKLRKKEKLPRTWDRGYGCCCCCWSFFKTLGLVTLATLWKGKSQLRLRVRETEFLKKFWYILRLFYNLWFYIAELVIWVFGFWRSFCLFGCIAGWG